jgi:hypothetical protein
MSSLPKTPSTPSLLIQFKSSTIYSFVSERKLLQSAEKRDFMKFKKVYSHSWTVPVELEERRQSSALVLPYHCMQR